VPLDPDAVKSASLDVHLGHRFVVAKRSRLKGVKLDDAEDEHLLETVGREEVFVPFGGHFLIHPGDLILGATLEFIALPPDVMAFVEGRSSLGRKGLIVATATQVAPGFHGVIVLEMANAGTVPLEVKPEMSIAQLVFQGMNVPVEQYRGKFHCQVHP
jgi:dCTP deaminase